MGSDVGRTVVMGGDVIVKGSDQPVARDLVIASGHIVEVTPRGQVALQRDDVAISAHGRLVAPGLVDLHGDAFERSVMPRGGVLCGLPLALLDNDRQLLASGITTTLLSATDSWEPGLRSRAMLRQLVEAMEEHRGREQVGARLGLHVRHERCNTDDLDELIAWIESGAVSMLSYGDHTPGGIRMVTGVTAPQVQRCGVDAAELERLQDRAIERRELGARQERDLAAVAARTGCPTASHDAGSDTDLDRDVGLGVQIAEFPMSIELAHQYRAAGISVLLGAPNLVRGGSHLNNLAVHEAWAAGAGDILCSDYHYPSLLQAPFHLAARGICSLAEAWDAVSGAPAAAAGLHDRGSIEVGSLADLVVVAQPGEDPTRRPAAVLWTLVGGEVGHRAA